MVVVSDLNKNFGGWTNLVKKRHGSADLHTPINPPPVGALRQYGSHVCPELDPLSQLKWYYDQKIISTFSSDFESVFA